MIVDAFLNIMHAFVRFGYSLLGSWKLEIPENVLQPLYDNFAIADDFLPATEFRNSMSLIFLAYATISLFKIVRMVIGWVRGSG